MRLPALFAGLLACCLLHAGPSRAEGLTLGATRLVYDATRKEASVPLQNRGKTPYLIQSWVADTQSRIKAAPFITTPPLFKLGADGDTTVRVVYVGTENALPSDRETLFLLNVRAVPAVDKKDDAHRLTVATQNIIKLIYRPAGLSVQQAGQAWQKISVTPGNSSVQFSNQTPYVITLSGMRINEIPVERPGVVMPFSSLSVPVPGAQQARTLTFSTINDYGGLTTPREVHF